MRDGSRAGLRPVRTYYELNIMHTLRLKQIAAAHLVACFAAAGMHAPANAQQPPGNAPMPPKLEKLDEGEAPEVNIRPPGEGSRIVEKRAPGGKVTEAKVTTGRSSYVVKANDQAGSALPGDGQASNNRGAQWEILEFDWSRTQDPKQAEAAAEAAARALPPPPPPPPPLPVQK
jgi:hypothetical protein